MNNNSLLIVSHDAELRERQRNILEKNNYPAFTAVSCETALEFTRSSPMDLIILDLTDSRIEARTFCKEIQLCQPHGVPILFLINPEIPLQLSKSEMDGLLFDTATIPVHDATLLHRTANLLELAASRQKIADNHDQLHHKVITRNRLASAIHQLPDAILIIDLLGNIVYANPACKKISGYSPSELIGRQLRDIQVMEQDNNNIAQILNQVQKGVPWHGTMHNRHKNDSLYLEEINILPVRDHDGNISSHVVVKKDITEQRRMEAITRSVNLMENVGLVFSGIRHELGNPVNSLKMTLSVLSKKIHQFPTETILDFLDRSQHEISRIEYLLQSLRSFSLFEQPTIQEVQLKPFLEKLMDMHKQDIARKRIDFQLIVDADVVTVQADERALHQVLLNLLTNAINALTERPDGMIRLTVIRESENLVRLSVEDNGCGISLKNQKMLFKPFFTTRPDGTGLGLVIVQKMLAEMHCSIHVESSEASGTTFSILLPEKSNSFA